MTDTVRLIQGNNRFFLKQRHGAALLLSDPPWGADTQNAGTPYEYPDDPEEMPGIIQGVSEYASHCRVSLIACDDRFQAEWTMALRGRGLQTKLIVARSELGNPGKKEWPSKHYYYVYAHRGDIYFDHDALPLEERRARLGSGETKRVAGVINATISNTDPERVAGFVAQKPIWLLRAFIEAHTRPGELVVDPFMGTGSTGIAAVQCGRRFLGVEKNPNNFQLSKIRIEGYIPKGN